MSFRDTATPKQFKEAQASSDRQIENFGRHLHAWCHIYNTREATEEELPCPADPRVRCHCCEVCRGRCREEQIRNNMRRAKRHHEEWVATGCHWATWCDCGPVNPEPGNHLSYCGQTWREALVVASLFEALSRL